MIMIPTVFIAVLSYVIGRLMHTFLPSKGMIGQLLNPGPVSSSLKTLSDSL
jgi:hypothetical protein